MKLQVSTDDAAREPSTPQKPGIVVTATVNLPDSKPEVVKLVFTSQKNRLRVGRDRQNELCLESDKVSRFHAALLMRVSNAQLFVADLESNNGTFHNGNRLAAGESHEIEENDLVRFGETEVRFNWKQAIAPAPSQAEAVSLTSPPEAQESQAAPTAEATQLPVQTEEAEAEQQAAEQLEQAEQQPEAKPEKPPQSVARSAGIVSIAVMGSRVVGLVREQIFAAVFGAGYLYDAYLVAFRIPNLLRDLFAEGALSSAFVKTFTDYQIKRSEAEAWRLASLVLNALIVVLSVVCLIGVFLSPYLIAIIAKDFPAEKAALTTTMTQIMFPFILLVAMAAVAMGVLNTKGIFGIPASASTVFNIVSIVAGLGFAYWLSGGNFAASADKNAVPDLASQWAIIGMAIGTMIGGAAQFLMQLPSLFKVGFRFTPILSFTDSGVVKVFKLMAPAILGTSAVQINVLVNTMFVSGIDGGQSWLSLAFRLMQFPIGVFGVAVGTAAIPQLSKFAAQNDETKFRETLGTSLRLVFLLTLPSACGLIVLGEPIIRLIYEHGRFDPNATTMTAWALSGYAIGLTGYAAIKVLSPAFYALDDARTPMIISLCSIAVNTVASYSFYQLLVWAYATPENPAGLGHVGVALATSSIALVNFLALAILMRRKIKHIEGGKTLKAFGKIAVASALMSAVSYSSYRLLLYVFGAGNLLFQLVEVFVPIALGGAVFLLTAKLLGVSELNQAVNAITRKLSRKR